jgi:hypothetical protein
MLIIRVQIVASSLDGALPAVKRRLVLRAKAFHEVRRKPSRLRPSGRSRAQSMKIF